MSAKLAPYDEAELSIPRQHKRHRRSEEEKQLALEHKFRLRRSAAAARARALDLEREAYSVTQSDQEKDDLNSSTGMRGSWSSFSNQARVSPSDCEESDPKVPWTRRLVESSRALLDRVKLRGHDARSSYTAVVPSCAEVPEGIVTSKEDKRGSRCEEATSVQSTSERRVEHRSSKMSRSMFGPRAAWFSGAKSDVSK